MSDSLWSYPEILIKKIPHLNYAHIFNANTNVVSIEIGPKTVCCKFEESFIQGPTPMINILPGHYVIITNPVITEETKEGEKKIKLDKNGQPIINYGIEEIRFEQEAFPLYHGEVWDGVIHPLRIVSQNKALRLKAKIDFVDNFAPLDEIEEEKQQQEVQPKKENNNKNIHDINNYKQVKRKAGDEWWFPGHATYYPQVQVTILFEFDYMICKEGEAFLITATKNLIDVNGIERFAGSSWLHECVGTYLPQIDEQIVKVIKPIILSNKKSIIVKALRAHEDLLFKKKRVPGEEWLITCEDTESYLLHPDEEVVKHQHLIQLEKKEFITICNPVINGKVSFDQKERRRGEKVFFLQPGEYVDPSHMKDNQIVPEPIFVLTAQQAIEVMCIVPFLDESKVQRKIGEKWLINGPKEYCPPLEVKVIRNNIQAISFGEEMNFFKPLSYYLKIIFPVVLFVVLLLWKLKRMLF